MNYPLKKPASLTPSHPSKKYLNWNTNRLTSKSKEAFYTELELLLVAQLPLKEALTFMLSAQKKKTQLHFYKSLLKFLDKGVPFFEGLRNQKGVSAYEWNIVKIGEESGELLTVIGSLAQHFKEKNDFRRSLGTALVYPILLLFTATIVVFFMLTVIVPLFESIFAQQQLQLPVATQWVIVLATGIKTHGLLMILGLFTLFFIGRLCYQQTQIRQLIQIKLFHFPGIKGLIQLRYALLFSQSLQLLLGAKVPLVKSLQLVKDLFSYAPLEIAINRTLKDISQGKSFGKALEETGFFNHRLYAFIHIGEATHQLEKIFQEMANYYNTKTTQLTKRVTNLIEPLIIIIVGLIIGGILVALYLPMFQLSTALG